MDFEDCPVWHSPLDTGWDFAAGSGIPAESIWEAKGTVGDNHAVYPLLWFYIIPAISSPDSKP